jgi:hypothetical protein
MRPPVRPLPAPRQGKRTAGRLTGRDEGRPVLRSPLRQGSASADLMDGQARLWRQLSPTADMPSSGPVQQRVMSGHSGPFQDRPSHVASPKSHQRDLPNSRYFEAALVPRAHR